MTSIGMQITGGNPVASLALGIGAGLLAAFADDIDPDASAQDKTTDSTGKGEGGEAGDRQRAAAAAAETETEDTKTTETTGATKSTLTTTVETLGNALLNPWAQTLFTSGRGVRGTAPVKRKSLLGA